MAGIHTAVDTASARSLEALHVFSTTSLMLQHTLSPAFHRHEVWGKVLRRNSTAAVVARFAISSNDFDTSSETRTLTFHRQNRVQKLMLQETLILILARANLANSKLRLI